jgi:hypothetical protein
LNTKDKDFGRITREEMYKLLHNTKIVISIPKSDSSPRSVYESIFCGCAVAVTYNPYIEILPACMKSRIIVVDLENKLWLRNAIEAADEIVRTEFIPSDVALTLFDQKKSMEIIAKAFY